jgi:hypothetical protein
MFTCPCSFKTPYITIFNKHKNKKCGLETMLKICRFERTRSVGIDEFIKKLIKENKELHNYNKKDKEQLPFYISENYVIVQGFNNLFKKKKGDYYIDYKWANVDPVEFIKEYIIYYNENSSEKKIEIENIKEYIDILINLQ